MQQSGKVWQMQEQQEMVSGGLVLRNGSRTIVFFWSMDRRIVRRFSVAQGGSLRLGTKGDRSTTEESGGSRRSGRW